MTSLTFEVPVGTRVDRFPKQGNAEFRWDGIVERLLDTYAEAGGPPPRAAGDGA